MTKDAFLKKVGKRITLLREKKGLSQTELDFRFDKDKQSLNRLEKGKINPSIFYLKEIALELDVSLKELLDFE